MFFLIGCPPYLRRQPYPIVRQPVSLNAPETLLAAGTPAAPSPAPLPGTLPGGVVKVG